jgi:signal transduction histidine kinase
MAIAMILLVFVQVYWIKSAVEVKEKQFEQLVNRTLLKIANDIQLRETYSHVLDEMYESRDSLSIQQPRNQSLPKFFHSEVIEFNSAGKLNKSIVYSQGDSVSVVRNDSVITMSRESYKNQQDSLGNNGLIRKRDMVENVIDRMFGFGGRFLEVVKTQVLDSIIHENLETNNIDLNYEFAVVKNRRFIVKNSNGFKPGQETRLFNTALFPDDFFGNRHQLLLYFPSEKNYIIDTIGFMIFSSAFLLLIIIFAFVFTIYIIFRQKQMSEIKNDFVNNMTHELKTPISTISLASQMLGDDSLPVESKNIGHISRVISDESKRLSVQVEKVLQTAVLDKGKLRLRKKITDLHDILISVENNFDIQVKNKGGNIKMKLDADDTTLMADPVHMTNIFANLFDNAVKYSVKDPIINIHTWNKQNLFYISISDDGIGISKKDQKKIFDKFYRVSTGDRHDVKGFGLGLSYVKKMVEEHGGSIKLDSEPGKGTTFVLAFPLNK